MVEEEDLYLPKEQASPQPRLLLFGGRYDHGNSPMPQKYRLEIFVRGRHFGKEQRDSAAASLGS